MVDFLEPTDTRQRMGWRGLLLGFVAGGLLLALGLVAARARLPEWQLTSLPDRDFFMAHFRDSAARIGVTPLAEPRLEVRDGLSAQNNPFAVFGAEALAWIKSRQRPVLITAATTVTASEVGEVNLILQFDLAGRPWEVRFIRSGLGVMKPNWTSAFPDAHRLFLADGESLGPARSGSVAGTAVEVAEVLGSPAKESASWILNRQGNLWTSNRVPGDPERVLGASRFQSLLVKVCFVVAVMLLVVVLAFVQAVRRRIDFVNAAVIGGFALAVSLACQAVRPAGEAGPLLCSALAVFSAVYLFFLWSAAESWLRATGREETGALDALRSGRIGRRVGRAVFLGLGFGGAIAGWRLLAYAAAAILPGAVPEGAAVPLPLIFPGSTPVDFGIGLAGLVLLGLAIGRQFFSARFRLPVSWLVAAILALPTLSNLRPWPLSLLLSLGTMGLLIFAFERAGSLALAVAGIVSYLLPLLAFSLQDPHWFGSGLWTSAALLASIGAIGLVGALRPESVREEVAAPEFVRRLEEEQRLQYETGMLARMQEGLLPQELPRVEGWEFAARTIQAHEVGGDFYDFFPTPDGALWVAAGDVAGHGISCSITHAMTKAALAALIRPGESPASVLGEVDRVLRTLTTSRLFTSLALLRLEPQTGGALFANAGYPYPLRREGREITELVLPGLPVGEGPARRYRDLAIEIPPGGALVFCSDGLAEALRPDGEPYGFDRPRRVLAAAPSRTAEDLLQALTSDWHREVGERAEDDTTLLVLRRRG